MKLDFCMVFSDFLYQVFLKGDILSVNIESFFLQELQKSEWN